MAFNPLPILIMVVGSLVFQAMVFGEEYAQKAFPEYEEMTTACTDGDDGFFSGLSCLVQKIGFFFAAILGVIYFLFDLITWNIPGAPWFIRALFGTFTGVGLFWSTATLFRGN